MDLFCEIPCLTEKSHSLSGLDLRKKFFPGVNPNQLGEALQKFVSYNRESFEFLEVTPTISGSDHGASIVFRTSRFIGAVPLRAPDKGKQIGDFVIAPRFVGRERYQDYIEILDLLGSEISPETIDSLNLVSGRNFRPPFYLEAVKFIGLMENLTRRSWRKFDSVELVTTELAGTINWKSYIRHEYRPEHKLRFPVRKNVLTEHHREYGQLRFVFDICSAELLSQNTPQKIRNAFQSRLTFLKNKLYRHRPIHTTSLVVRSSDSPLVRECKNQANRILTRELVDQTAWRVDFNDVFEKFVQHIFKEYARTIGGKLESNPRIRSGSSMYYGWELRQLEPDAVLRTDNLLAFIDAKYKSHLFNRFDGTESLRESYRRDLHQVLAYTTFTKSAKKLGIICYPSTEISIKMTKFRNPYDDGLNTIMVVGIPLRREVVPDAVTCIGEHLDGLVQPQF